MPAPAPAVVRVVQAFTGLAALGLAAWWIIYLAAPRARAAFIARLPGGRAPRLPLTIAVIGWISLAAGGGCIAALPILHGRAAMPLGARVLTGAAGQLCYMGAAAVALVIGMGLLQLRPWARIAGVVWVAVSIVNIAVMCLVPGVMLRLMQSTSSIPGLAIPVPTRAYLALLLGIALAAGIAEIYFLWTRRPAFYPASPALPATAGAE